MLFYGTWFGLLVLRVEIAYAFKDFLLSSLFCNRYHVPRSWFRSSGNVLVIFEEKGGDPTKISFSRRVVTGVCGFISDNYPFGDLDSWDKNSEFNGEAKVTLQLKCPESKLISSIRFASFGTPNGTCGSYLKGNCHDPDSISVVEKVCSKFLLISLHDCPSIA